MFPLIEARPTSEGKTVELHELPNEVVAPKTRPYARIKPMVDFSIALVVFVFALPMILLAGLLVRLTSRGPALYTQVRLGRNGRPYFIYKLRTMRHDCEAQTGPKWCTKGDTRITPIGRILRRTHIDELPQLWNVLRGDMSLVGPRPERPEIVTSLEVVLAGYRGRLDVKPGITGLAQIQLPPDTDLASVREKLILDLVYVQRYGAWLDLRLILGTVLYLVGVPYARVRIAMGLPAGHAPRPLPRKG